MKPLSIYTTGKMSIVRHIPAPNSDNGTVRVNDPSHPWEEDTHVEPSQAPENALEVLTDALRNGGEPHGLEDVAEPNIWLWVKDSEGTMYAISDA